MNSPSLNSFYQKIEKKILLAGAYTEREALPFIIKSCRLKPYSYIFEKKNDKIFVHDKWFDEFSNSLLINHNKIKIIYNDLSLDRKKITCTDLYANLAINQIFKISKLAYLIAGKEEDSFQEFYFINLLGLDNYWRSYLYNGSEWQAISPLWMRVQDLEKIYKKQELQYFIELDNKNNIGLPCFTYRRWLTCLPFREELINILKKENELLLSTLQKE